MAHSNGYTLQFLASTAARHGAASSLAKVRTIGDDEEEEEGTGAGGGAEDEEAETLSWAGEGEGEWEVPGRR